MGRKKIIYFSLLFILVVICTITYFSYAFLIKTEEHHGKLNIVTGTLNYSLTADNLTNNSITVGPGKTEFNLVLRSLNKIDSKYQLYYQAATGVVVGYSDTNKSTGIVQANDQVTVKLIINNTTNSNQIVIFGVEGGFYRNDLVLSQGTAITEKINTCDYTIGQTFTFDYNGTTGSNGNEQEFNPKCDGMYKLETWGAQGGSYNSTYRGGYGGYSVGNIELSTENKLYINVGGHPTDNATNHAYIEGGYNGGGATGTRNDLAHNAGGGATHIALNSGLLSTLSAHATDNKILIVAGGGGGATSPAGSSRTSKAGEAGGYIGTSATTTCGSGCDCESIGTGGSQTTGGTRTIITFASYNTYDHNFASGLFGLGSSGDNSLSARSSTYDKVGGSGGGGGYYGGSGNSCVGAGGGGSSYIANTNLTNKYMYCYGCSEDLTNAATFTVSTTGSSSYKDTTNCLNGYSSDPISKCAKAGHGYAKITYLGE